jgi:hypothetical protein
MTKEEQKQFDEAYAPLIAYENEQQALKEKHLKFVKDYVVDGTYNDILEYIKDCDSTSKFEITEEKPKDEDIEDLSDDFDYLKTVWVDQYCNGGYIGDDFAGWVFIKITDIKYLKFHYSM